MRFFGTTHMCMYTSSDIIKYPLLEYAEYILAYIQSNEVEVVYFEWDTGYMENLLDGWLLCRLRDKVEVRFLDTEESLKYHDNVVEFKKKLIESLDVELYENTYGKMEKVIDRFEEVLYPEIFKSEMSFNNIPYEDIKIEAAKKLVEEGLIAEEAIMGYIKISAKIEDIMRSKGLSRDENFWDRDIPENSVIIAGYSHRTWFNSLKK